jgi:hypothetical protein
VQLYTSGKWGSAADGNTVGDTLVLLCDADRDRDRDVDGDRVGVTIVHCT